MIRYGRSIIRMIPCAPSFNATRQPAPRRPRSRACMRGFATPCWTGAAARIP